jgi:hypothetical protein
MIVVRVELWSAVTGQRTELARMEIANDETGTAARRNYITRTLFGRSTKALNERRTQRSGRVKDWPSEAVHIWNLISVALTGMGYGDKRAPIKPADEPERSTVPDTGNPAAPIRRSRNRARGPF